MTELTAWNQENYLGGDGIIVASDIKQEWMLKWWWENYSKHNDFPVTFFDIGMSKSARIWCETKGNVISFSLPPSSISEKSTIPRFLQKKWEDNSPSPVWEVRKQWMHKPFIILQSPYTRTIWIDIDCEIKQSLEEAFDLCNEGDGISMVKFDLSKSSVINTGVIVARRHSPALSFWAKTILEKEHTLMSDESALIETQKKYPVNITPLPIHLNFLNLWKPHKGVGIYHHLGSHGKTEILKQIK